MRGREEENSERGMKRGSWERSAICFFRDKEDKNASSTQRQNVGVNSGVREHGIQGGGNYKGHRGREEREQKKREVDRWKTERGEREKEQERVRKRTRVWVWQRCERTGHTHTSGGDMTRHAASAQLGQRSALPCCFGMALTSLTNTHTHTCTGTQTDKQIQLPTRPLPHSPSSCVISRHTFTQRQTHTSSHPKCHDFG